MKLHKYGKKVINFVMIFIIIISFWFFVFSFYGFDKVVNVFVTLGFLTIGLIVSSIKYFWKSKENYILWYFLVSFLLSLWTMFETIDSHDSITAGLLFFTAYYVMFLLLFKWDKIVLKITESYVLWITVSFVYWFIELKEASKWIIIAFAMPFIVSVIIHSFTRSKISRGGKIIMSFWSSIVLFIFTYDYIKSIYYNLTNELLVNSYKDYFLISFEYFVVGNAILYICSNWYLFAGYLMALDIRNDSFEIVGEMNKLNESRFSEEQSSIKNSILIMVILFILYGFNYYFKIIPLYSIIFLTFFLLSTAGIVGSWRGKRIKNNI